MNKRAVSGILLTLLLVAMITLAFNIQPVRASGTVYIRPDGTVEGTDKIHRDGDVYTFTDNINITNDSGVAVQRNNIVIDGAGYTLQGLGIERGVGMHLNGRSNVTIKNMEIRSFFSAAWLYTCSNCNISGNNITNNTYGPRLICCSNNNISSNNMINNYYGIELTYSSNNSISGNNVATDHGSGIRLHTSPNNIVSGNSITGTILDGFQLYHSSNNSILGNTIASSYHCGIVLFFSSNHTLSGNTIANGNEYGLMLAVSSDNVIHHNNFVNNIIQARGTGSNSWDDGYPSGGNYWSDYAALDEKSGPNQDQLGSDGIGDTPYVINGNNQDNYPLMATPKAIDYVIQGLSSSEFDKPEEDIEDTKSDFMEKLADVEETIKEGNFERAIEHLQETRNFTYDQIIDTTKREEIIAMINGLTAYLENFL